MSEAIETYRLMGDIRKLLREQLGKPCPACQKLLPRAHPKILLPQGYCRMHGYQDPRPETLVDEFYRQYNIAHWPRDPANGRLLCAPDHPMPKDLADQQWAHTGRVLDKDGEYRDWYRCRDCGHTWAEELPE